MAKTGKTKEIIAAYSEELKISIDELIIMVSDVCVQLKGIYIHPDLIIEYASFLFFALQKKGVGIS